MPFTELARTQGESQNLPMSALISPISDTEGRRKL